MKSIISSFPGKAALAWSLLLFLSHWLAAQPTFVKTYGNSNYGTSVVKTYDGGYAFCGGIYPSPTSTTRIRILIGKTDSAGTLLWMKNYSTNDLNYSSSIVQTADSGLVVSGTSVPYNSNYQQDAFILKCNSMGDSLWGHTMGNPGTQSEYAYDLMQARDGSLITVGTAAPGVLNYLYMTKTSPDGTFRKQRQVENAWFGVVGRSVAESLDGNYLFAASQGNPTKYLALIKTDTAGNTLWARRWTKPGSSTTPMPESLVQLPDSTILISATINYNPNNNLSDSWIVKCNRQGDTLKTWTFPQLRVNTIIPQPDGGFTLSGRTPGFSPEGRLIRVAADGQTINWEKTYSFYPALNLESAIPLADKGYLLVGSTTISNDNKVLIIRTDSLGVTLEPTAIQDQKQTGSWLAFPNPTEGKITISMANLKIESIRIMNMTGVEVLHIEPHSMYSDIEFSIGHLPKGVYRLLVNGQIGNWGKNLILK